MTATIRHATRNDINELVALGSEYYERSNQYDAEYDHEHTKEWFSQIIGGDSNHFILVAREGGVAVGMFVGVIDQMVFSPKMIANQHLMFVSPNAKSRMISVRMMRIFEAWAKTLGAVSLDFPVSSDDERVDAIASRLKMKRVGAYYRKNL